MNNVIGCYRKKITSENNRKQEIEKVNKRKMNEPYNQKQIDKFIGLIKKYNP
jgi:hypothetical protein